MPKFIDLTGRRFGRWTVLKRLANNKHRGSMWFCGCSCGKRRPVQGRLLKNGQSKSCGCLKNDLTKKRMINEKNPLWAGGDVGHKAVHEWLKTRKPIPTFCELCRERPSRELSFDHRIGRWTRNIEDYQWLCTSCHRLKDAGRDAQPMTKTRIHRIREFYRVGAAIQRELADLFKISQRTIGNIVNRKDLYSII